MREIFVLFLETRSLYLRNLLVKSNVGLARKVAHQYDHKSKESYHDLEQIALFGLIKAVERFNPHQQKFFTSFALPYIKGEILHYLRDKGSLIRVPRRMYERAVEINAVRDRLTRQNHCIPTSSQIAEVMGITVTDIKDLESTVIALREHRSLDAAIRDEDKVILLGDALSDDLEQEEEVVSLEALWAIALEPLPKNLKEVANQFVSSKKNDLRQLETNLDNLSQICPVDIKDVVDLIADYGNESKIWSIAKTLLSKEQQQWFFETLKH